MTDMRLVTPHALRRATLRQALGICKVISVVLVMNLRLSHAFATPGVWQWLFWVALIYFAVDGVHDWQEGHDVKKRAKSEPSGVSETTTLDDEPGEFRPKE